MSRTQGRVRDYLTWRFPGLRLMLEGRRRWWLRATALAALVAVAVYAVWAKTPTGNGVLDNLISVPAQLALVVLAVYVGISLRVRAVLGEPRLRESAQDEPTELHVFRLDGKAGGRVWLDCRGIEDVAPLHALIESSIRFLPVESEQLYRMDGGGLDVPKAALSAVLVNDQGVCLHLRSVSYHSVFFSHYFADYRFSRESTDEVRNRPQTLRELWSAPIERHLAQCHKHFAEGRGFRPFEVLPNPLGVTGVCRVAVGSTQGYIVRLRDGNVLNERHRLDWSFSGLIESHRLIGIARPDNVAIERYVEDELMDELFGDESEMPRKFRCTPLALIFNPRNLYQPELVVMVDLELAQLEFDTLRKNMNLFFWSAVDIAMHLKEPGGSRFKAMFRRIGELVLEREHVPREPPAGAGAGE